MERIELARIGWVSIPGRRFCRYLRTMIGVSLSVTGRVRLLAATRFLRSRSRTARVTDAGASTARANGRMGARKLMQEKRTFAVFSTFDEENQAESRRRAQKTPEENCREMAALQVRRWGEKWTSTPIERVATWERVPW